MATIRAGGRVRAARQQRAISQSDLAREAGISRQALSAIEAGAYNPNVGVALRLSRALGVNVESLFGEPALESVTAGVAQEQAAGCSAGSHVCLGRVGGRLVAVPRPSAGLNLLPSSGVVEQLSREGKARIASFRTAAEIDATLLMSGCDPAAAVLSAHLAHRAPFVELVSSQCSSLSALDSVAAGHSHVGGVHLREPETGQYNLTAIRRKLGRRPSIVINFARWELGIASRSGGRVRLQAVADLLAPGVRIINRQTGSGARMALDEALAELGATPHSIAGYAHEVAGHLEVAEEIGAGRADAGLTLRVAAEAFGLDFAPLREERYDLVVPRRDLDSQPVKALLEVLSSSRLAAEVSRLCFYDTSEMGKVLAEIG